jgi:hypothetical protein
MLISPYRHRNICIYIHTYILYQQVSLLLGNEADKNMKNKSGISAMDMIEDIEDESVKTLLQEAS